MLSMILHGFEPATQITYCTVLYCTVLSLGVNVHSFEINTEVLTFRSNFRIL